MRPVIPGQTRYSGNPLRARDRRIDECMRLIEALGWGTDNISLAHQPMIGEDVQWIGRPVREYLESLTPTLLAGLMAALTGHAVRLRAV